MKVSETLAQSLLGTVQDIIKPNLKNPADKTYNALGNWVRRKKSGLSKEDQMAYDNFVSKFVSKGINVIQTAIQSGLADPYTNTLDSVVSKDDKDSKQETSTKPDSSPPPTTPAANVTMPTTQPAVQTAPKSTIIMPDTYRTRPKNQVQQQPTTTPVNKTVVSNIKPKNVKFTLQGDTYTKKGDGWFYKNVRVKPETEEYIEKMYQQSLTETINYFHMKMLFEAELSVPPGANPVDPSSYEPQPTKMSISQYVKTYFVNPYLRGISFPPEAKTQIDLILQNLPRSINDKKLLADDLKKIADIAWAIALASNR